jgi:4-hydroxy-tetrahydrodipicolinate reductase
MNEPVTLLIHGAGGRMGRALLRLAAADPTLRVVAAISRGGDALAEAGAVPVLAAAELASAPAFDVAIDFSQPEGFSPVVALCRARRAGLVSGTTGLEAGQRAELDAAAADIALLWAANFSAGVAVLAALVRQAAAALPDWDADIVETHHVHKKDAPSGTALQLGAALEAGRGRPPHYASLRAGDVVGEHLVQLTGPGERLELAHRATDRDIFARGALLAARQLAGRAPGRYDFGELLLATRA